MHNYIDEKFFGFMGIDIKNAKRNMAFIRELCDVKKIRDYSETELRERALKKMLVDMENIKCSVPIYYNVKKLIEDTNAYSEDVDCAYLCY